MKKKISKSELIRSIIAKNPGIKAADVVTQLKKDGVVVSQPLVYAIINKKSGPTASATPKKRGRKPGSSKAAAPVAVAASNDNELFSAMQSFVNAAGGLDRAITILSVFKK